MRVHACPQPFPGKDLFPCCHLVFMGVSVSVESLLHRVMNGHFDDKVDLAVMQFLFRDLHHIHAEFKE